MKKSRLGTGLLILCILAGTFVGHVLAEEEYHVILTLEPSIPSNLGGYGGEIVLNDDYLLIGEWSTTIGEFKRTGRASLYDTDWNLISTLQAPNPEAGAEFSHSVDLLDDIIVSSCPNEDVDEIENAGRVYVYDTGGALKFSLQSPAPFDEGQFGFEVALGKDILLISETGNIIDGVYHPGSVHIYDTEGVFIRTLLPPSMKTNGNFGNTLAVSDEYIIVGEYGSFVYPLVSPSVHVFDYSWNLITTIQAPEQGERTIFGKSMTVSGDTLVIGELWATVDGFEKAGRAHVYDADWNLVATLQSPTPESNGEFGRGTAIGGDLIVVGERRGDVEVMNEGKAYVFDMEGSLVSTLTSPDPIIGAQFGYKVATDGVIVIVSDVEGNVGDVTKAGKVHVFGLGEPAAEQTAPEEETTEAESESETESEKSGGIPGFPLESVVLSIALAVMVLWLIQRQR